MSFGQLTAPVLTTKSRQPRDKTRKKIEHKTNTIKVAPVKNQNMFWYYQGNGVKVYSVYDFIINIINKCKQSSNTGIS